MTNLALQENELPLVGQILKEARISQGLSLEEIAKTLCISKRHLIHLEEAREDLICDVYTLGFLKSYVQYLRLDEKDLCKMFKNQALQPSSPHHLFPAPPPGKGIPSRYILAFSFFILLAVIGGWKWVKYSNSQTYSPKNLEEVKVLPISNTIVKEPMALQNPSPLSENFLKADTQAYSPQNEEVAKVVPKSDAIPEEPVALQNPSPPSEDLLKPPSSGKMTTPSKKSTSDPQVPILQPSVLLKTTEEVWIEVRNDKADVILSRVFKPGESYEFKNPQHLVLTTKDASKTHLTSGQKTFTFPGNPWGIKSNIPLDPQKWVEQSPETH